MVISSDDVHLLTMERVAEAEAALAALTAIRQSERDELMQAVPSDENVRADLMRQAPGLDYQSLKVLQDYCNQFAGALAAPMSELQKKIRGLWETLRLPEAARAKYRWMPGMPLAEDLLHACTGATSPQISSHLPKSPHISPDLLISPQISSHSPRSPHISHNSPYLPTSPHASHTFTHHAMHAQRRSRASRALPRC